MYKRQVEAGSAELTEVVKVDIGEVRSGERIAPDRLLMVGEEGSALVGTDGAVVRTWPTRDGEATVLHRAGTKCAVVQPNANLQIEGDGVELIDIATGETLVELSASVESFSGDGCSLTTLVPPQMLVLGGEIVDLGDAERVATFDVATRRAVLVHDGDDGVRFELLDLASGETTELPEGGYRFYP